MKFLIIALALVASSSASPQRQRGNQQYNQQRQYNQQQQQQQQPQPQAPAAQQQQYNQQPQQPQQYNQQPQARSYEQTPQNQPEQSFKQPIAVQEYKPQQEYRQSPAQQRVDEYRAKGPLETTTWIPIIRFSKEQENDGSYKTAYETGNNIVAEETGFLKNVGESDREALVQHGSFTYTSPEGQLITVQYTADEFGFRATGDHIPTPPPVSPEIQKGLDLIYAGIKANQDRLDLEAKQDPAGFAKKQADRAALDLTGQYYPQ